MMHKNVFYDLKIYVTILSIIFAILIHFECRFGIIHYWGSNMIHKSLPFLVNYRNVIFKISFIREIWKFNYQND